MVRVLSKFNVVYNIFTAFSVYTTCAATTQQDGPHNRTLQDKCCSTPDLRVGKCVHLRACEPIVTFVNKAPKPLSQHTLEVLLKYQCDKEYGDRAVCCPSGPISIGNASNAGSGDACTPADGRTLPSPPNVSQHKNINLLASDCSFSNITPNQREAHLFQFPWMALLSYRTSGMGREFKCVGTIVNERYILTAAHCLTNLKLPLLGVRIGEHDMKTNIDCEQQESADEVCAPPVQDLRIEKIIPHPLYNKRSFHHDIGLVRVARMNLSVDNARPVCLPLDGELNYNFNTTIVTGWGIIETGRRSTVLLQANIPAFSNEECTRTYEKLIPIQYHQICAGLGNNATFYCSGNGGEALHVPVMSALGDTKIIQEGVFSFGPKKCGTSGFPDVYTRIAYYRDWILDSIKP